jgi:hypothetical protein
MRSLSTWVVCLCLLGVGCSDDDSDDRGSGGGGGTSSTGTTVVACNTGSGPNEGCSEVPVPNAAVQAFRDACTQAGSVVSDSCPTAGASAKCVPAPNAIPGLTPNVIYWYALVDDEDIQDAREDCEAMPGTFTVLPPG